MNENWKKGTEKKKEESWEYVAKWRFGQMQKKVYKYKKPLYF